MTLGEDANHFPLFLTEGEGVFEHAFSNYVEGHNVEEIQAQQFFHG